MNTQDIPEGYEELPPDAHEIVGDLERDWFGWEESLSELADNSLDAAATNVVIDVDRARRRVIVQDNGEGCPEKGNTILQKGRSHRRGGSRLGRYGVGLTHASYQLAGSDGLTVITTSNGVLHRRMQVRWGDLIDAGRWFFPVPEELTADEAAKVLPDGRGTHIMFTMGKRRGFMHAKQTETALRNLAFRFSPALRATRQIQFIERRGSKRPARKELLRAPDDPRWSDPMPTFEVRVKNKVARVRAGILDERDTSGRRGMSYTYGHRVIIQDESDGMGEYSKQGFAGLVELGNRWTLAQNKTKVTDDDWPALCTAIYQRIQPMLEKLKQSSLMLNTEHMRPLIASALNQAFGSPESGWHRKGDGKKKRNIRGKSDGPGSDKGKKNTRNRIGRIVVDFYDGRDEERAGKVEGNGLRVELNESKAVIREAIEQRDDRLLVVIAASLLCNSDSTQWLTDRGKRFADRLGTLLAKPIDTSRVVRSAGA